MIKRIQLVFILGFILHTSKAQQVFECPEFGFKFVISYEFDGYNGNSIPLYNRLTHFLRKKCFGRGCIKLHKEFTI